MAIKRNVRVWTGGLCISFIAGCASFQAASDVQKGRRALINGNPQSAASYFERAAKRDPQFRLRRSLLRESIRSYLGRAQYDAEQWEQASNSLQRALEARRPEPLAQLYLGLLLAREGKTQLAQRETQASLNRLADRFNDLEHNHPDGRYWDPDGKLRKEIAATLVKLNAEELNLQQLIAQREWIGKAMEEEIDLAR